MPKRGIARGSAQRGVVVQLGLMGLRLAEEMGCVGSQAGTATGHDVEDVPLAVQITLAAADRRCEDGFAYVAGFHELEQGPNDFTFQLTHM